MKNLILIALLTIVSATAALAQYDDNRSKAEREVLKLNKEYNEAIVKKDMATLERVWADDFFYAGENGKIFNKAESFTEITTSAIKLTFGQRDDVNVRVSGDTAVVTGLWNEKGVRSDGTEFNGSSRYTTVFAKRKGRWQIVADHLSEFVEKTDQNALKENLINLEKQAWEAIKNKDSKYFQNLMLEDFVGVADDGVYGKANLLSSISNSKCELKSYLLDDFNVVMFNADTALVISKVKQNSVCDGKTDATSVRASTLYIRRDGKWLAAFHQGTKATH